MSDALEGNRPKADPNARVLFVPPGIVSWDSQTQHGVKLLKMGYTVQVHDHSYATPCGVTDRCGQLTLDGDRGVLVPDSKTATPQTEADN